MAGLVICVKWSGKEYEVAGLEATDTVEGLKVIRTKSVFGVECFLSCSQI